MRAPSDRRRRFATAFAIASCIAPAGLAASAHAASDTPAPTTSRGLVGGLVGGVTTTVDGTLVAVSQATNGAVTLPSVTTITDPLAGTISVVDGAVDQVVAPVPASGTGPRISLSVPGLINAAGSVAVGLVIGNAGDTACSPLVNLAITGKDGIAVAGGITQLTQLLPGATNSYALPWPAGLDTGNYSVKTSVSACGAAQALTLDLKLAAGDTDTTGRSDRDTVPTTTGTGGETNAGGGVPPVGNKQTTNGSTGSSSKGTEAAANAATNGSSGSSLNAAAQPNTAVPAAAGSAPIDDAMAKDAPVDRAIRDRANPGQSTFAATTDGPPAPKEILARSGAAAAGITGKVEGAAARPGSLLGDGSLGAVVRAAPAVIERAAPALGVLGLIAALFLVQEALARRDPKLALAPVGPAEDLEFDEASSFLQRVSPQV